VRPLACLQFESGGETSFAVSCVRLQCGCGLSLGREREFALVRMHAWCALSSLPTRPLTHTLSRPVFARAYELSSTIGS
jgi:hypothetical protein